MAKKKTKKKKATKKKAIKKKTTKKKATKKKASRGTNSELSALNRKLDKVLKKEKQILRREKAIQKEEKQVEKFESIEANRIKKLQKLEGKIMNKVDDHPLTKVTHHDFSKGVIGAIIGLIFYLLIFKNANYMYAITLTSATSMYLVAFILGFILLYFHGFKKVRHKKMVYFVPGRLLVIYFTSIVSVVLLLLLFGQISVDTPATHTYIIVSAVSIVSVVAASLAEILGHH